MVIPKTIQNAIFIAKVKHKSKSNFLILSILYYYKQLLFNLLFLILILFSTIITNLSSINKTANYFVQLLLSQIIFQSFSTLYYSVSIYKFYATIFKNCSNISHVLFINADYTIQPPLYMIPIIK